MNKQRRAQITKLIDAPENIASDLDMLVDEEREAMESLPENLQGTEQTDLMEEAADQLETAVGSVQEAVEAAQNAIE